LPWVFRPDLLETLMNDESKPRNAKDPAPSPPPADTTAMARPRAEGLAETLGDVPLVVRVEVGSVELPAKQWASLGVGDAVGLGRRLGDRATLRVSGVAVARGELVDLDGELGVRILERLAP
jgi:flagellar motor switch protein FliM